MRAASLAIAILLLYPHNGAKMFLPFALNLSLFLRIKYRLLVVHLPHFSGLMRGSPFSTNSCVKLHKSNTEMFLLGK